MLGGNYIFSPKFKTSNLSGSLETSLSGGISGSLTIGPAASSDSTPNATNWAGCSFERNLGQGYNNFARITGIDVPITLSPSWTGVGSMYYRVSNTALTAEDYQLNVALYQQVSNAGTITVTNNQYVAWLYTNTTDITLDITIRLADATVLDTFPAEVYFEPF